MAEQETKIEITDESSEEVVLNDPPKETAFDGPFATNPDDLTDRVIDDIARSEVDEVIRVEDEKVIEAISRTPTLKEKINTWFHSWWDIPKKRYTVLGLMMLFLITIFAVPPTRYAVLNTVGIRASATIVVLDESTSQPLKNVEVIIRGQTATTNVDGYATVEKVRLGSTDVTVKKLAYAETTFKKTIGLGDNKLNDAKMTPIGSQFKFEIVDWLSKKAIDKAEVEYWESSGLSDQDGEATLTIEPTDETEIEVTIKVEGYRDQRYKLDTTKTDDSQIDMKAGQASYFISNRNGKYDLYKIYPGEEAEIVVVGTGSEREDMRFVVSPDRKYGVLVSTRDEVRNGDGYLLSGLYRINLESSEVTKLDESERIDLVGWVDQKLAYIKIASGASGKNPNRHRLQMLDLETLDNKELAASNYFNDVVVTDNKVFYAPSDAYKDNPDTSLFKADSDGNISKIYDAEVWSIVQTSKDELTFDATGDWYSYSIQSNSASALSGPPTNRTSRIYVDGPDGKTLWVDQRDGKGVLLAYNKDDNSDKVIWSQSGLSYPVQWLSDKHVVFRVNTNEETADYIINLDGGDAVKLSDVSNISGTDRWYYY